MSAKQNLYTKAQRRLVASLLADSRDVARVMEIISVEDIEEPSYALIFDAISSLARANETISDISVGGLLEEQGNLRKAGGPQALFSLLTEGSKYLLETSVVTYARIVKEAAAKASIRRELKEVSSNFMDDSGTAAADGVADLQSYLNERLLKLSDASTIAKMASQVDTYADILRERQEISEQNASSEGLQGIPSLLPSLNRYTTGWKPGNLITIGARTGIGKSVLAINCAVAACMANKSVMFFSLEMDKASLMDRVVASTTGISLKRLSTGNLTEEDRGVLDEYLPKLRDLKLTIDDEPKITIDGIRARAIRQAQSEEGLDFIIVDYLQLITTTGRFASRQEAVADMSRNMKLLAKQLGVPIMILVQLNRKTGEDNGLPELNNIRESDAIAQDSDAVILIHRDEPMDGTTPHTLILLKKNRGGESNKVIRCHTILECSIFREVTKAENASGLDEEDSDMELMDSPGYEANDDDIDLGFSDIDDLDEDLDLEL